MLLRKLLRRFADQNPFKDAEGRFINRWDVKQNPTVTMARPEEVPEFKIKLEAKIHEKRVFDFELPPKHEPLEPPLQIWSYTDSMFSVNQVWIPGPILIFPEYLFMWHGSRAEDIEDHHLDIARIIEPKIEYIIIGTGKQAAPDYLYGLKQRFRMFGIHVDFSPTVFFT